MRHTQGILSHLCATALDKLISTRRQKTSHIQGRTYYAAENKAISMHSRSTHERHEANLMRLTLDVLADIGIRFAVLHHEGEIDEGTHRSDLDLVVDQDPMVVLRRVRRSLRALGLHPVVLWRYDRAGLAAVLLPLTASSGVQLDLVYDPAGRGRYGLRSGAFLDSAVAGRRWLRVNHLDEALYTLRKRQVKGHRPQVRAALSRLKLVGSSEVEQRITAAFSPKAARSIRAMTAADDFVASYSHLRIPALANEADRYIRRLRTPAGYWVHLGGAGAQHLAVRTIERLDGVLRCGPPLRYESPPSVHALDWIRRVAPLRWRPALAVTWGEPIIWPRPDLLLARDALTEDEAVRRIVTGMEQRLTWAQ